METVTETGGLLPGIARCKKPFRGHQCRTCVTIHRTSVVESQRQAFLTFWKMLRRNSHGTRRRHAHLFFHHGIELCVSLHHIYKTGHEKMADVFSCVLREMWTGLLKHRSRNRIYTDRSTANSISFFLFGSHSLDAPCGHGLFIQDPLPPLSLLLFSRCCEEFLHSCQVLSRDLPSWKRF